MKKNKIIFALKFIVILLLFLVVFNSTHLQYLQIIDLTTALESLLKNQLDTVNVLKNQLDPINNLKTEIEDLKIQFEITTDEVNTVKREQRLLKKDYLGVFYVFSGVYVLASFILFL